MGCANSKAADTAVPQDAPVKQTEETKPEQVQQETVDAQTQENGNSQANEKHESEAEANEDNKEAAEKNEEQQATEGTQAQDNQDGNAEDQQAEDSNTAEHESPAGDASATAEANSDKKELQQHESSQEEAADAAAEKEMEEQFEHSDGPKRRNSVAVTDADSAPETSHEDKQDETADENVVTAGPLKKRGKGAMQPYKTRYVVLDNGFMMYYKTQDDYDNHKAPIKGNRIELKHYKISRDANDKTNLQFCLKPKDSANDPRVWEFKAHNKAGCDNWIEAFVAEGVEQVEAKEQ